MGFGPFSSESNSSTTNTTQNAAFSEVTGSATSLNITGGGKKSNQQINVSMLDGGAIAESFKFANSAVTESLKQVELAGSNTKSTVSEAVKAVSESARSEVENIVVQGAKWAALAVIAWAGFWALSKMRG